jgi:regulator of RNase E activity RraA
MHDVSGTLEKLRRYDTPTICNVIELFQVRPRNRGFMDGRIRAAFHDLPPMVGFACTAAFRSDQPPSTGDAYGNLEMQLERYADLPGPAVMVFQDLDDPPVGATFGEVMCSTYQAFGARGLITSGGGRDLEQVHALRFPVFTGSVMCAHADCHLLHLGLPVRVGGLTVQNGELLHGDLNGVTQIPREIADEVADITDEFIAAEALVMDYVKGRGEKSVREFAERSKAMTAAIGALRDRVSRRPRMTSERA